MPGPRPWQPAPATSASPSIPRSGRSSRVNTTTAGAQQFPVVAYLNNGNIVAAWASNAQDGAGYGVYAQRHNATGTRLGTEFKVNTVTTNNQTTPAIARAVERHLRDRVDLDRAGWIGQRHLRPALLVGRRRDRLGIQDQHHDQEPPVAPGGRRSERRRLRGRMGLDGSGHLEARHLCAALRQCRPGPRHGVQGQHRNGRRSEHARDRRTDRRRLRDRLGFERSGRRGARHLRPALRRDGEGARQGVQGQHRDRGRPVAARRDRIEGRRLRRRVAIEGPGRFRPRRLCPALQRQRHTHRRGAARQHRHRRRSVATGARPLP